MKKLGITLLLFIFSPHIVAAEKTPKKKPDTSKSDFKGRKERILFEALSHKFFKAMLDGKGDIKTMITTYNTAHETYTKALSTIPDVEINAKLCAMGGCIDLWKKSYPPKNDKKNKDNDQKQEDS